MNAQNVNQRGQQAVEVSRPRESCRAAGATLTIEDCADIVYATLPVGWRQPVVDEIAAQDERTERRRDADEHPGASNTDNDWGKSL